MRLVLTTGNIIVTQVTLPTEGAPVKPWGRRTAHDTGQSDGHSLERARIPRADATDARSRSAQSPSGS